MAPFNYKNAYKLAIQTNRELHISLDAYKVMNENLQKDLKKANAEINRLRDEIRRMRVNMVDPEN